VAPSFLWPLRIAPRGNTYPLPPSGPCGTPLQSIGPIGFVFIVIPPYPPFPVAGPATVRGASLLLLAGGSLGSNAHLPACYCAGAVPLPTCDTRTSHQALHLLLRPQPPLVLLCQLPLQVLQLTHHHCGGGAARGAEVWRDRV